MKSVNSRIKQALKEFTTQRKGRILVNGNYYEVYNVEYYADCYDDGKVIGNAIASQLDFDLPYMPKFDTFKYYDGVWTGSSYEYVDMGTFNVFDEKDQDEFNKHITAFDNLIKFNVPFEEVGTYPKTLYAELQNICNQAGVTLGNLSIPNGSFIIENNQYVNGESLKTVLKQICGISGNYAIMKDNTLYLQLKNTTDEVLDKYQHTPTDWKRRSYGINQVIIGDSQVEGEYVIREDAEDIELNGVHKLEVLDNLFAYTQDKRDALIDALWNQVRGFGYVPYETSGEWLNYLEIGDTITIDNVETILLRINAKSPKAVESTISAPAIIDSSIEYVDNTNDIKNQLRRTEVKVDKQNQTIELLASEVEETQEIVEIISTPIEEQTGLPMYIENAEGGRLIDMKLYGDTYQETYSGKNLLELPNTQTINGITFTKNNDGTFNLSGTATANADFIVEKALDYISIGYYTASVENTGYQIQIAFYNNNSWLSTPFNKLQQEQTKTSNVTSVPSNANKVRLIIRVSNGVTINLQNEKAQLEKGSTATSYEKYVGGIPSPNPDYPQNIETVTGRQDIYVCGKNLFDKNILQQGGLDLGSSGGETVSSNRIRTNFIEVQPNTNYVISNVDTIINQCGIGLYKSNNSYDSAHKINSGSWNNIPKTFTTQSDTKYIRLVFRNSNNNDITPTENYKIQLEKGTQATTYAPYQGSTYELNLGKNLFDKNNANILNNCTINSSTKLIETNNQYKMLYIPCLPNTTYTISKVQSGYLTTGYTDTTPALGVYVNGYVASSDTTKCTITTNSTANYIVLRYYRSNDTLTEQEIRDTIQIEKGSTPTSYSKYKTPIELCKISTYKDKIYKQDGKWFLYKEIGKVVLDGSSDESYSRVGNNSDANYTQINMSTMNDWPSMNITYSLRQLYLSNYFSYYDNATGSGKTQPGFKPYSNGNPKIVFSFPTPMLTTGSEVASFKTWLSTHNTIIYLILNNPIITEITDEELINQLNAIELFEGINNVSITSEDLPADAYMKYYLKTPLSGTYVKHEELNAKLTITTEEITSEVSAKYETKTDANGKLIEAKGYTDGQLVNYSTTTEMNSAITQKANEITSTVAETYSTKAETTTAKDEAIASANSTTDDKLSSYSTTSEMNTEIQQTASAINTRINKISTNINEETGEVESVTTTTGYKFDENGLSISRSDSEFSALHNNTGTYYKDNDAIVSQTTKDGTITKDMVLYGRYFYGVDNDLDVENFTKDDAMFIAEMYEDGNGEIGFGHFLNNLGGN